MIKIEDTDIGYPVIQGQILEIDDAKISFLAESNLPFELLLLSKSPAGVCDIVSANPQGPYNNTRYENLFQAWIDLNALTDGQQLICTAYVSTGNIGDLLFTVDRPRLHSALRFLEIQGIGLFEIRKRGGGFFMQITAEPYTNGLSEILQKHTLSA